MQDLMRLWGVGVLAFWRVGQPPIFAGQGSWAFTRCGRWFHPQPVSILHSDAREAGKAAGDARDAALVEEWLAAMFGLSSKAVRSRRTGVCHFSLVCLTFVIVCSCSSSSASPSLPSNLHRSRPSTRCHHRQSAPPRCGRTILTSAPTCITDTRPSQLAKMSVTLRSDTPSGFCKLASISEILQVQSPPRDSPGRGVCRTRARVNASKNQDLHFSLHITLDSKGEAAVVG